MTKALQQGSRVLKVPLLLHTVPPTGSQSQHQPTFLTSLPNDHGRSGRGVRDVAVSKMLLVSNAKLYPAP